MQNERTRRPQPGDFFVERQFIVIGPDLGRIQKAVQEAVHELRPRWDRFDVPDPKPTGDPVHLAIQDQEMVIYEFEDIGLKARESARLVGEVVLGINRRSGGDMVADLNYLTRSTVLGEPWEVGGSPEKGLSCEAGSPSHADFLDQWAFWEDGIHLKPNPVNTPDETGRDVDVYVFDTWPLADDDTSFGFLNLHCVQDKVGPPFVTTPYPWTNVPDHGLFVAGLIGHIAPDSRIHLIRVLHDDGQGEMGWLISALNTLDTLPDDHPEPSTQFVLNLSLSVRVPTPAMAASIGLPPGVANDAPGVKNALQALVGRGAVVVAAAGNSEPGQNWLAYPARYDFVVGVVGSTITYTGQATPRKSCFSHYPAEEHNNVAAPAGDGLSADMYCIHPLAASTPVSPHLFLISLATKGNDDPCNTGYAYWSGTSFATPLVSALAARLIEQGAVNVPTEIVNTCSASTDGNIPHGIIKM